jgi:hypothetical protein
MQVLSLPSSSVTTALSTALVSVYTQRRSREPRGATRQQAIAEKPAKQSARPIHSLILVCRV